METLKLAGAGGDFVKSRLIHDSEFLDADLGLAIYFSARCRRAEDERLTYNKSIR